MEKPVETATAISPEQSADLAALQAQAGEAAVAEGAAPAGVDLAAEIKGLVLAFVAISRPLLPSLGGIYTEETTGAASEAVARLCQKYGWLSGGLMGDYGEEVAAAIVLLPLGVATYQGVRTDLDALKLRNQYLLQKKQADLQQHMNIAHNLDGQTEPAGGAVPNAAVQGWQPAIPEA